MILAADVGGTKTLFGLFDESGKQVTGQVFQSNEYSSFEGLFEQFWSEHCREGLSAINLAIAGPIENGECKTTNLPWHIKSISLQSLTGVKEVNLLNDLEATAIGILNLPDDDFVFLNDARSEEFENIVVLAAGTGLGEAFVTYFSNTPKVISTEGGHVDFAPSNDLEIDLLRFLQSKYNGHVSYERVVSGMGIADIYEFLGVKYADESRKIADGMIDNDVAARVSQMAIAELDQRCVETMNIFFRCYGAIAGNLALQVLAYGGIVLAGGIAAKNLELIKKGQFMEGFIAKGRYADLLKRIPIKICTNQQAALYGAMNFSLNKKI